jgi:tetratricopeptide (TPR) repeat protein
MIQSLLFSLLLWIWDNRSFDTISRSNRAKVEGQEAYNEKQYKRALEAYQTISTTSLFAEPESRLNLAHTYFQLNQLRNAKKYYTKLAKVSNVFLASRALNQLGIIETLDKDTAQALLYFRQSLRLNPDNDRAQYNFELLKKRFNGKEKQTRQNIPQQNPEKKQTETEQSKIQTQQTEEKKNLLNQLKNLKMSEEQAMIILEAMKASEIQYLQQKRHQSTVKDDSNGKW